MNLLDTLKERFAPVLAELAGPESDSTEQVAAMLELIRPAQDARFGHYQANIAMPLGKRLKRPPREVAAELIQRVDLADLCEPPEVAGPGFINLRIRDCVLSRRLGEAVGDERLGVDRVSQPRTYLLDYSAPNVAKPMHVGHIRSTVIGDALCRMLRYRGHRVISDNHLGDWGTQFGMIIYGFKHFLDEAAYEQSPVEELARLYRLVNSISTLQQAQYRLGVLDELIPKEQDALSRLEEVPKENQTKKQRKAIAQQQEKIRELKAERNNCSLLTDGIKTGTFVVGGLSSEETNAAIINHPNIAEKVLAETAKLHAGDEENLALWRRFMPICLAEIERVYGRLGVEFDETLGESFYQDRLAALVGRLLGEGVARESDGATAIFLDGYDVPMLVRKRDGAFLYATTDLATIEYRMDRWQPDAILYVVDHRQSLHFEQLFKAARLLGYERVELRHVAFGTVLGEDNRPFRTRSGDTVALEGLLDEAVRRAGEVVAANDAAKPGGAELSEQQRQQVAETVGIGALKYADLSQNRTSDYVFSYDKMLAMNGNTGTYMQYAYARVRSIFRRGGVDVEPLRRSGAEVRIEQPEERALAVALLRLGEAIDWALGDYRPNLLTSYLFELADQFTTFYEKCPVLKAESEPIRQSRLLLCDLTARTIRQGLSLLGIDVVEQM